MRAWRALGSRLCLLIALAALVTGCTSQSSTPTPATDRSPTPTEGPGLGAPALEVDPEGELVTSFLFAEPDDLDPQRAVGLPPTQVARMVFEGLMVLDPATMLPAPGAAAEPPEVSADGLTYTFTLREDLVYSDGSPLTAHDFVFGYQRGCDPRTRGTPGGAASLHIIAGCEDWNLMDPLLATEAQLEEARASFGVRALDERRIEFTLAQPAAYFTTVTTTPIGAPVRRTDVESGGDQWAQLPTFVGNGPFKLVEWRRREYMTFERNENYRLPVKLRSWRIVMIADRAVEFAAYRNNEVDILGAVGPEHVRAVEEDPALRAQEVAVPGAGAGLLLFNTTLAPFDDPLVRLAFAKAVDRTALAKEVKLDMARPATGFIPFGFASHDPADDAQALDVDAARRLLAGSSYGSASGLPPLTLTFMATSAARLEATWLQQQLRANLGVQIALEPIDFRALNELIRDPRTAPPMFTHGIATGVHPHSLTSVWSTGGLWASAVGYGNAEFDRLVREADSELDQARSLDLYLQAGRILSRDAPAAWLSYGQTRALVNPRVQGLTVIPLGPLGLTSANLHDIYLVRR